MSEIKSQSILASAVAAAADEPITVSLSKRFMKAEVNGFFELIKLHSSLSQYKNSNIHIDVDKLHSFDPALAAPLMVIIRHAQSNKNKISFINIGALLRHQLELHQILVPRNALAKSMGPKPSKPPLVYFGLKEFLPNEASEFAEYSKKALDRIEMPRMTISLKQKFFEGIDELFENSALHSNSRLKNVSCGVYNRNNNSIKFVFADGGHGMKGAYEKRYATPILADRAINWAMTPGSTTRQGGVSGGLGLKIVREFIKYNEGKISVVSRDGYWSEKIGICSRLRYPSSFPGTIVTIEINTLDTKAYDLDRTDPNNIW